MNSLLAPRPRPDLRALVVDESALSRSVLSTMLRAYGIQTVTQATRPEEALRLIRGAAFPFDVIVCDYNFATRGSVSMTGQDLLDDLRQSRGLPMKTAFIMVTDEARYENVAECVEGALDDYLLKPLSAARFEDRLSIVMERKSALASVFTAIDAGQFVEAADMCEELFAEGGKHRLYAARIGSELFLRLQKFDAAQRLFQAVIEAKAVPWAKLGLAQVQLEVQGAKQASRALETLLAENPTYADAYDVLGRALVEEGQFEQACETLERAVALTPANVRRLQKHGALAFLIGQDAQARTSLDAAVTLGANSRALDYQTLFLHALAHYDAGTSMGWDRAKRQLEDAAGRLPDSYRVQSLFRLVCVVEALDRNRLFDATELLKAQAVDIVKPEFDFELAINVLHLVARVGEKESRLERAESWVRRIAERFGVSRASGHFLEFALTRQPALQAVAKAAVQGVNDGTRAAMSHVVNKQYDQAATELLTLSQRTLNARVFALGSSFLERHGASVSGELALSAKMALLDLQETYAAYGTHARVDLRVRGRA